MNREGPPRSLLLAVAVGVNLVWALSYPFSKSLMHALSPMALSTARLAGGTLLVAPLLRRRDIPPGPNPREWALLAAMGLLGCGAPAFLQYEGTVRSTASNVAMIVSLEPSVVALMSALVLRERLQVRQGVALFVALLGVAVITVDPGSLSLLSSRYLVGNSMVLASIFFYSSYTVAAKELAPRWGGTALVVLPFAMASLFLLPTMALFRPGELRQLSALSASDGLRLAFIVALATAAAYMVWNWLLRSLRANEVALSLYIQPIAGALLSTWILGDKLAPFFVGGSLLVLVALVIGQPRRAS